MAPSWVGDGHISYFGMYFGEVCEVRELKLLLFFSLKFQPCTCFPLLFQEQ